MYGATAECLSDDGSLLNQAIEDLDLSQSIGHTIDIDLNVDTMKECIDESKQQPAVSVYQQQTTAPTELSSSCSSGSSISSASSQDCDYQPYPVVYGYDAYPVTGRLTNILHDYTIFSKVLGSGGSGTVRECLHRRTNESFAVKTVDKAKIGCIDHLRREIEVLSSIQHTSIIRMVDCYEDLNYVHIVTEKCSGGELFDKIDRCFSSSDSGCFDERSAARTIKSLLGAVAYLHANGLVHRDIKPENILLESQDDDDSPIKLIDFGSARRHRHDVDCNMSSIHGTIYYMAPELLKYNYSSPADIWSIGVVAYILLTGYPPFNGETDAEIHASILRGNVNFPSDMGWSSKSVLCLDFIKCLLQKDPTRRLTAQDALLHPWILQYDDDDASMISDDYKLSCYHNFIEQEEYYHLARHCPMA